MKKKNALAMFMQSHTIQWEYKKSIKHLYIWNSRMAPVWFFIPWIAADLNQKISNYFWI